MKPESMKKTILHGVTLVLGVLVLGFLALPYFAGKEIQGLGSVPSQTGYDLLDFSNVTSDSPVFSAVSTLLLVIAACVVVLSAILALLNDFNLIKNETFKKVVNLTLLVSAVLVTIFAILNMIACPTYISDQVGMDTKFTAGWAGLVLNLVCGLGATAAVVLARDKKQN